MRIYLKQEALQFEIICQINLKILLNLVHQGGMIMKVLKKPEASFKKARIFNLFKWSKC